MITSLSRRNAIIGAGRITAGVFASLLVPPSIAFAAEDVELMSRFEYLSQNGNSNCSRAFLDSIATMPVTARLKGSCCSPMDAHRYIEQIKALRKYADVSEIPPDPYDITAGLAQKVMKYYDLELSAAEQPAYDYAMTNSDEKGPCCCQCWRWQVYGGLAKLLIREHHLSGSILTEVWNLSSGCGGGAEHHHG
jgi:hypothetical protein